MAENSSINLPGGFGGLMRYNEEYKSMFNLKPTHVILFVILIVALRVALPIFIK
jgi:preprotein translocase subunit Sec61beta